MATQPKNFTPLNIRAPNLPIAPVDYSQSFQDQFSNVLRLYFNQIDNLSTSLFLASGGSALSFPHIGASCVQSQYATSNTPTLTIWDTLDDITGFTLNPPGTATAKYAGVYKIDYSLELANTDNAAHNVTIWLRVNDVDVPRSATIFTVPARKSVGNPGFICGYSTATFTVNAGDTIGLWWATDQAYSTSPATDGVYMYYTPAQTTPFPAPSVPSAIGAITFVSIDP